MAILNKLKTANVCFPVTIEEGNLVEVLDGLADCLVTLSYLVALVREADVSCFEFIEDSQIPDNSNNFYQRLAGSYQRLSTDFPMLIDAEIALLDVIGALNSINDHCNEDVDVVGVIEEVLDSNWSKFPYLDQVIPMEECKWIEDNRGKEGVCHSIIDNKFVFRDKGGKIMKPSIFKEPNIAQHICDEEEEKMIEEIKIGSVVQVNDRETGLEVGEFYEVVGIDEEGSLDCQDIIYQVSEVGDRSDWDEIPYVISESWIESGWVAVLQGDEEDHDKIDASYQVARIREKIAFPQETGRWTSKVVQ